VSSCPHCDLIDQPPNPQVTATEDTTITRMVASADAVSACTCATNLKQNHSESTGLDRIEDCRSLNTLDLGQGVVVLTDRDEKPPRCAGCHERSKHRLGLTIDHRLVAVVWLCDRHKRLVEYGSWAFQIEPNYGVPWHQT
jgi:hypothetical protein